MICYNCNKNYPDEGPEPFWICPNCKDERNEHPPLPLYWNINPREQASLREAAKKQQAAKLAQCLEYGHQFFTWGREHKRILYKRCTYCNLTQEQANEFEVDDHEPIAPGDYRYYTQQSEVSHE